ncbi:hypothetical protein RA27_22025 [Ruegeria sp. ANG-R]|nr:hypothetical protein RA27_22025 [Ruegeria sp. ANG-R]
MLSRYLVESRFVVHQLNCLEAAIDVLSVRATGINRTLSIAIFDIDFLQLSWSLSEIVDELAMLREETLNVPIVLSSSVCDYGKLEPFGVAIGDVKLQFPCSRSELTQAILAARQVNAVWQQQ